MRKSEPANAAFIESLQTAKTHELSQLSNGTKRAERGARIFTQECVTLAILFMFFTSQPPAQLSRHFLWRWRSTGETLHRVTISNWVCCHRMGECEAFQICTPFSAGKTMVRITSTQIQMDSWEKDNAGPPWVGHHFKTWERQWQNHRTQILDVLKEFLVASGWALSHCKMFVSPSFLHSSSTTRSAR